MTQPNPIIFKDWQNAVADSPHEGIGLLRNVDIESFPGAVKVSKQPTSFFSPITTRTFTAVAATDICTASGTLSGTVNNYTGMAVYFTTTGTLPAGLSTNTVYYLIYISSTTFYVATSYKNSVGSSAPTRIDITDTGSGVHTINQIAIGTINWIVKDSSNSFYWMLDSNGRVWFNPTGSGAYLLLNSALESVAGTITNAGGNGLQLLRSSDNNHTYLFVFRKALIDVIEVTGTSSIETPSWTNGWQSLNSTITANNQHHAFPSTNGTIYFGDARYVGSILEKSGQVFDPSSAATYTYNNQALALPQNEVAQCIEQLGDKLLTGGKTFNQIYPWDRVSGNYSVPLSVAEFGVYRMKNMGNLVYILAGTWGNVYLTQGTYVRFFKKVPIYIANNAFSVQSNPIVWGGLTATNGALLLGIQGVTSGSSGAYLLYPDGRLVQDNTPSTGSTNVVGIYAENNFYLMGYSGGADNFNGVTFYANYEAVLHSSLYRAGNKTHKEGYSQLEVQMAKPASIGHFRIKYRFDTNSSWSDFPGGAVTGTADGIATSWDFDIGLTDVENVQIQVEMDGAFELMQVALYP